MKLSLRLRTPRGLLLDRELRSLVAEDLDGWFGIAPGRADLAAVLPPGLLVFRDGEGEGFVALDGGLLHLRRGECRVLCREAVVSRELDQITGRVEQFVQSRRARQELHRGATSELVREALRRMGAGAPA